MKKHNQLKSQLIAYLVNNYWHDPMILWKLSAAQIIVQYNVLHLIQK